MMTIICTEAEAKELRHRCNAGGCGDCIFCNFDECPTNNIIVEDNNVVSR